MNFFEKELSRIAAFCDIIVNPSYAGRACFCDLGGDNKAKLEFVTHGYADHYTALSIKVLNRSEGEVDKILLHLEDVWGRKKEITYHNGVPHIYTSDGKSDWYGWKPANTDIQRLAAEVGTYLAVYKSRDIVQEKAQPGKSDKTSIVKPLRGANNPAAVKNDTTKKKKSEQDL
jgi:hypothetical protein